MKKNRILLDFIKYVFMNVCGMIGLSCYILADTFFVSRGLGTSGLAALNIAIPIYSFIHGAGLMLGAGGATRYTIAKSQNKHNIANGIFTTTIIFTILFALVFVAGGIFFSDQITVLLGADAQIFDMTNIYIKVIMIFSPAFMLNDIFINFVRNDGAPGLSMAGMLIGSFANIIFDYILIFPFQLGIFGAVLATGFAPIISMGILLRHKIQKKNEFHFSATCLHLRQILKTMSLGVPSLITELSSGLVIIIFNIIILALSGNIGVAAYGVIANLSLVVVAIYTGIGQGIQPIISREYGRGDMKNTHQILKYAIVSTIVLSILIYGIMFFFADPITRIFNSENNMELQKMAVEGLKLYFLAVIFVGFNIVLTVYFTSIEKPMPAQVISLLRGLIIIIPMAYILAALLKMTGVWLAFPVTEALVFVIAIAVYVRSKKKYEKKKY